VTGPIIIEELHFSTLKILAKSPMHLRHSLEHGFVATPPMDFGTLGHTLTLGGQEVAVWDGDRRGNNWKYFKAENAGKLVVTKKDYDRAAAVRDAVLADPVAAPLLAVPHEQKEVEWVVSMYGRKCAGRIDVCSQDTIDLKVVADAHPIRFGWQARKLAYHAQIAWYQDARRALGQDPGRGILIAVESKPPHAVVVRVLTPRMLEEGRKLTRLWIEELKLCEEAQSWHGYAQTEVELDAPDEESAEDSIVWGAAPEEGESDE
jgi:hypothetical protein